MTNDISGTVYIEIGADGWHQIMATRVQLLCNVCHIGLNSVCKWHATLLKARMPLSYSMAFLTPHSIEATSCQNRTDSLCLSQFYSQAWRGQLMSHTQKNRVHLKKVGRLCTFCARSFGPLRLYIRKQRLSRREVGFESWGVELAIHQSPSE